jgi:hypothetical protein
MQLGQIAVMVLVKPLSGMVEDRATGLRHRAFAAHTETWVPAALCASENGLADPRFQDSPPVPVHERFPVGTPVVCVGPAGYGMLGAVQGFGPDKVLARFPATAHKQIEFGHVIAGSMVDTYVSLARAAQTIGLPPAVLDKVLGSVVVQPKRIDLGLNLRVGADKVIPGCVLGTCVALRGGHRQPDRHTDWQTDGLLLRPRRYCRSTRTEAVSPAWTTEDSVVRVAGFAPVASAHAAPPAAYVPPDAFEYSPRALELVLRYRQKFPKLFEALARKQGERDVRVGDLFGKAGETELDKVALWLQQIPTYKLGCVALVAVSCPAG